jgi:osmotically-inducible protein OsmY
MSRDQSLERDVKAELSWDPHVDAVHFGVSVDHRAVTLSGVASSYAEKQAAIQAAERVYGVQAIADEIQVRVPDADVQDDTKIAEDIERSFRTHVNVPSTVKATVRDGGVTLTGHVDWNHQRSEAERLARNIKGVSGVADRITLRPQVSFSDVQKRVSEAIRRNADLDARSISVTVHDGTICLHGHVHSFHERKAAERAAFAAPGVVSVDNQITIQP